MRINELLRSRRGRRTAAIGGGLLTVVVAATWLFWPTSEAPRSRQYADFTACMLTDAKGIAGAEAKPVWNGLGEASLSTNARVEYLSIDGVQSQEHAVTVLNTLAHWQCNMIFASSRLPIEAVEAAASRYPEVEFYTLGGTQTAPNLTILNGDPQIAARDALSRAIKRS